MSGTAHSNSCSQAWTPSSSSSSVLTSSELELIEREIRPGQRKVLDAQLELLELEPGASNLEVEAESQREAISVSPKKPAREYPGRFGKEGVPESVVPNISQSGRDGWYHSFASELFHEPVQEIRFHRLQRRSAGPQLAAQRSSARLIPLMPLSSSELANLVSARCKLKARTSARLVQRPRLSFTCKDDEQYGSRRGNHTDNDE